MPTPSPTPPNGASPAVHMLVVLAVALWQGMIGVLVKWIPWPPLALVCARCSIASLALWSLHMLRRRMRSTQPLPTGGALRSRDRWIGGLLLTGHWGLLFIGYRVADVGPVLIAVFTYPVLASIAEPVVFKRPTNARQVLTAALGATGVMFLVTPAEAQHDGNTLGVGLGLLSAACFAARNIHARVALRQADAVELMAWQVSIVALMLSPALLSLSAADFAPHQLGLVLLLGLLFTALPHTLHVWAHKGMSAAAIGIIASLQVLSGMILASVLLEERLDAHVWSGAAIVVLAVLIEGVSSWRQRAVGGM